LNGCMLQRFSIETGNQVSRSGPVEWIREYIRPDAIAISKCKDENKHRGKS
jgi:hypothetical protein